MDTNKVAHDLAVAFATYQLNTYLPELENEIGSEDIDKKANCFWNYYKSAFEKYKREAENFFKNER